MGKAFVIKGVNFADNKIETVSFSGNVPCTGVEVTPATITFTGIGSTQELTIVKTPENTTDEVTITSSDESVCTVSNGVVTAVGMGTATITVTCGEASDTVDVTFTTAEVSGDWATGELKAYGSTTMYIATDEAGRYIFSAKSIASGSISEIYYMNHEVKAFVLPSGCNKVRVTMEDFIGNKMIVAWYDSASKPYGSFPNCIEGIQLNNNVTILQAGNEFTVPSGADRFAVGVQTDETQTRFADMSDVASAANIKIYAVMDS